MTLAGSTDVTAEVPAPRNSLLDWKAFLAISNMDRWSTPTLVFEQARSMSKPCRRGLQLTIIGTECCTDELIADGDIGDETLKSLNMLYEAAGSPRKQQA